MHLTTVTPAGFASSDLRSATVQIKYDGRMLDIDSTQLGDLDLDGVEPVRILKSYPGRKNYSGVYWARTTGRHHWFESLYEKSALSVLDRDATVVGFATQPFKVAWASTGRSHFPDVLARRRDGSLLIIDARPRELIYERDREVFEMTAVWAASSAMEYRTFSDLTKVQDWNLRLLAGYRYERWACPPTIAASLIACRGEVRTLSEWVRAFEGADAPARGLLLAAIWHGALEVDLSIRLEFENLAVCAGRGWE